MLHIDYDPAVGADLAVLGDDDIAAVKRETKSLAAHDPPLPDGPGTHPLKLGPHDYVLVYRVDRATRRFTLKMVVREDAFQQML